MESEIIVFLPAMLPLESCWTVLGEILPRDDARICSETAGTAVSIRRADCCINSPPLTQVAGLTLIATLRIVRPQAKAAREVMLSSKFRRCFLEDD